MSRLSTAMLRRASIAAQRNAVIAREIGGAMLERYGVTHSDTDCDELIDPLDYGQGVVPTLAECDAIMTRCGHPPLAAQKD